MAPTSPTAEDAVPGHSHGQVYFVLHTYVAAGYEIELAPLLRERDGHAPGSDIRVRKHGLDPTTCDRYIEELAFAFESGASQPARAGN